MRDGPARARRRHDRVRARASCCARSSCRSPHGAAPTTSRSCSSTTRAVPRSTPAPICRTPSASSPTSTTTWPSGPSSASTPRSAVESDCCARRAPITSPTTARCPAARRCLDWSSSSTSSPRSPTSCPTSSSSLVGIARRGRSMGVHLVLATQRPGAPSTTTSAPTPALRIALRLQHASDARDVVGDDLPARFPRGTPGRVMMRLDEGDAVVFQAARSTGPPSPRRADRLRVVDGSHRAPAAGEVSDLSVLVQSIRNAAALSDLAAPHRPWLPPLPARVRRRGDVVGLLDVPAAQRQEALRWSPADGNLAIIGALGTGTTTALLAVVRGGLRRRRAARPPRVRDRRARRRAPRPAVASRPLRRRRAPARARADGAAAAALGERARRAAGGRRTGGRPKIVLAVDGHAGAAGRAGRTARRRAPTSSSPVIVAEGPAMGIACVLTAERPAALPPAVLASCAERWILHLDDPSEGVVCGVPAALVPAAQPGRAVVASSRLETQIGVATLPAGPRRPTVEGGPVPIGELPARVRAGRDLPAANAGLDGASASSPVSGSRRSASALLDVPDGEHVLVAGPARSGRTSALVRLARAWQQAHPDGLVAVCCPLGRSALASWPGAVGLGRRPGQRSVPRRRRRRRAGRRRRRCARRSGRRAPVGAAGAGGRSSRRPAHAVRALDRRRAAQPDSGS